MAAEQDNITHSHAADLDQARLALARLHADEGQSLRSLWLTLGHLALDALDVERIGVWSLIDDGRALRCQ